LPAASPSLGKTPDSRAKVRLPRPDQ